MINRKLETMKLIDAVGILPVMLVMRADECRWIPMMNAGDECRERTDNAEEITRHYWQSSNAQGEPNWWFMNLSNFETVSNWMCVP